MRTSKLRALGLGAFALAALLASGAPAGATVSEGDTAIPFEGKEFFNTNDQPVSLSTYRGRVILYELFSTT